MKKIKILSLLVIISLIVLFPTRRGLAQSLNQVIIAHSDVESSSLTKMELRDIFLGKITKWSDGSRIFAATLRSGVSHVKFLQEIVGKNPRQYSTYWKKAVFTGTGTPLASFKTEKDILKYVSETPGAIGYINSDQSHSTCKMIKIL